jgi:hypothetical protein
MLNRMIFFIIHPIEENNMKLFLLFIFFALLIITINTSNLVLFEIGNNNIIVISNFKTHFSASFKNQSKSDVIYNRIPYQIYLNDGLKYFGDIPNPLILSSEEESKEKQLNEVLKGGEFRIKKGHSEITLTDYIYNKLEKIIFQYPNENNLIQINKNDITEKSDLTKVNGKLITFQNNGPGKISLVFLSNGYLSTQEQKFISDCQKNIAYIKTVTPLRENINLLNIYGIFQASPEEGASVIYNLTV